MTAYSGGGGHLVDNNRMTVSRGCHSLMHWPSPAPTTAGAHVQDRLRPSMSIAPTTISTTEATHTSGRQGKTVPATTFTLDLQGTDTIIVTVYVEGHLVQMSSIEVPEPGVYLYRAGSVLESWTATKVRTEDTQLSNLIHLGSRHEYHH
ncbi:hypothetical protein CLAFUW4_08444 [Fulvia fulva]|uniref:Uncharacterized protein n=1 Tax=Passalora fulva TaxID=5499 RepID=A0A9Q8LCB3_PASFU|nr:uncharacterized protein CLAFUR5_08548 [Fulvia fulva]KAK4629333.1 hypothetical protein CLAFUR4_08449 [Fulvia fulva]KAK4630485.1 hypothetical protein CLAFUR0_08444 [Fulvia fulva]UJO14827.1 hypothetical protein CLAFUR5_08548 [Fulvia fulva]WPV12411.1 hypothetical protein CLAFUW4_08444 [Fulvia fulva]WPV27289.1 hypothetical protein CLAFUW7_08444 [Fulvia fulva]